MRTNAKQLSRETFFGTVSSAKIQAQRHRTICVCVKSGILLREIKADERTENYTIEEKQNIFTAAAAAAVVFELS